MCLNTASETVKNTVLIRLNLPFWSCSIREAPQKLQQIGSRLLLVSGNVTYVIDKLERNGFLVREQDPKDKRSVYAHLTDKGNEYLDKIYPIHSLRIARAFSGLMPEEQEQLIALLKKAGIHSQHLLFR